MHPAAAPNYPAPKEGDWIARDFRFHTREIMPELRLHYRTIGDPSGEPMMVLHDTTGTGGSMLAPAFTKELFGPAQPLDVSKHLIVLPDGIRAGGSSKPSDGQADIAAACAIRFTRGRIPACSIRPAGPLLRTIRRGARGWKPFRRLYQPLTAPA